MDLREDILKSNLYVAIGSKEEKRAFALYFYHRVLLSLYNNLSEDITPPPSWQEYIAFAKTSYELISSARQVMAMAVSSFLENDSFNFSSNDVDLFSDSKGNLTSDSLKVIELVPIDTFTAFIDWFFFQAEYQFYFQRILEGNNYAWTEYLAELQSHPEIYKRLRLAFVDALARINFDCYWDNDLGPSAL